MSGARVIPGQGAGATAIGRDHPVVASILRRWRELTGGRGVRDAQRRTLVACSGGADSLALAAALACVSPRPVLGHVLHDLRDPEPAGADRDAVAAVARALGCGFAERSVFVRSLPGNDERNARHARYRALRDMAIESGCPFIATGHHADDQLETLLMHLMRGAGVRGMRGVRASRRLEGATIVRPMLAVTRAEIEGLCDDAGLAWRHDHTNDDHGYLRNRIRHTLTPVMREIEPDIARRAAGLAQACGQVSDLLTALAHERLLATGEPSGDARAWERDRLGEQPDALLAELLRLYADRALGGRGADTLTRRAIAACVGAIKSDGTDPVVHRVGPMVVTVTAHRVRIEPAQCPCENESAESTDD